MRAVKGEFRGLPAFFRPASLIGTESAPISLPDLLQSKARAAQQGICEAEVEAQ